jgi:hypothetical protein
MLEFPKNQINAYQLYNRNKWTIEEISNFKQKIENQNLNSIQLNECLKTIYEYNLSFNDIDKFDNTELHKKGINNFFKGDSPSRNIEELIKAHRDILKEKEMPIPSEQEDLEIIKRVNNIKQLSQNYFGQTITKDNISPELKSKDDDLIAIINNVVKEVKGYSLRDSQIYSLIILLKKKNNKVKIAQILTGEGKTIIINCLTIIMVLKGHKVDIITSNPIYQKEMLKNLKKFIKNLELQLDVILKMEKIYLIFINHLKKHVIQKM